MMTHHQFLPQPHLVEKQEETREPPQELYGMVEKWKVHFGDQAARVLWKVCRRELPTLTVPTLMWELELAWDRADKKKINKPVAFLIDACRGACRKRALYPDEKPRKEENFSSAGELLQKMITRI